MTEHWLNFQNGPARRSLIIVRKQLKYYQIRQFYPPLRPHGALGADPNRQKKPGTFLPSLEEIGPTVFGKSLRKINLKKF